MIRTLGFVAPLVLFISQLQCSAAFVHPAVTATPSLVHSMVKSTSSPVAFARNRKHRLAMAPRMAGSSGVRVKNAGLIGEVVPNDWIESQDFVRDGRNLKTGDLVLVGRSDGRLVLPQIMLNEPQSHLNEMHLIPSSFFLLQHALCRDYQTCWFCIPKSMGGCGHSRRKWIGWCVESRRRHQPWKTVACSTSRTA